MAGKPFRRGKSWSVVVELSPDPLTGERRQRWVTRPTRKEVLEEQTRLLRERDTGTSLDVTNLTVGAYLDHWLETIVRPKLAVLTYERHEGNIRNHIKPAIGSVPLTRLSSAHIAKFYADLSGRGYAANTVRGIHGCLHAALRAAMRWQMIPRNVADIVDVPRADKAPAAVWDAESLARFLELIQGRRFEPHYLVALNTGARMGEILALRWTDLDLPRAHLALQRQQIRSTRHGHLETATKGKRARAITLTPETVAALRSHRIKQNEDRLAAGPAWRDEGRVFPNGTGMPLSERTLKGDWARSLRRWGLPHMHFHGLRHLHATYLLIAGVHPKVVSERLGHSSTAITMEIYSHVTPGLQEGAALAFEAALKVITRRAEAPPESGADRG